MKHIIHYFCFECQTDQVFLQSALSAEFNLSHFHLFLYSMQKYRYFLESAHSVVFELFELDKA